MRVTMNAWRARAHPRVDVLGAKAKLGDHRSGGEADHSGQLICLATRARHWMIGIVGGAKGSHYRRKISTIQIAGGGSDR